VLKCPRACASDQYRFQMQRDPYDPQSIIAARAMRRAARDDYPLLVHEYADCLEVRWLDFHGVQPDLSDVEVRFLGRYLDVAAETMGFRCSRGSGAYFEVWPRSRAAVEHAQMYERYAAARREF